MEYGTERIPLDPHSPWNLSPQKKLAMPTSISLICLFLMEAEGRFCTVVWLSGEDNVILKNSLVSKPKAEVFWPTVVLSSKCDLPACCCQRALTVEALKSSRPVRTFPAFLLALSLFHGGGRGTTLIIPQIWVLMTGCTPMLPFLLRSSCKLLVERNWHTFFERAIWHSLSLSGYQSVRKYMFFDPANCFLET